MAVLTARRPRGTTSQQARTRRRFVRRQWARRWGVLRAVLGVLLLSGVVSGAVWLLFFSRVFAVTGVEVRGEHSLTGDQVRLAAAVPGGTPLATLDTAAIDARVEALAPVRAAEVTRLWPDRVLVRVRERTPVAVVEIGDSLRGMDADGVVFLEYRTPPRGLPSVVVGEGAHSDALVEAARVVSALPRRVSVAVDHVEVATIDQISLVLRDGRVVRWGSADDSAVKSEVLGALLAQPARSYDVSVPGQPTLRR